MKRTVLHCFSPLLFFALMIVAFFSNRNPYDADSYDLSLGSAKSLAGTTMIISVFADDIHYSWDFDESNTSDTKEEIRSYLGIATNYLSNEAAKYNVNARFIYDFDKHPDLAYYASFPVDTVASDSLYAESSMNHFISTQIPIEQLRKKYRADNIVYFMFVNTDEFVTYVETNMPNDIMFFCSDITTGEQHTY